MKFWRHSLLATISFIAVSFTVVYTSSCTEDSCTKLKCRNGGTCVDGYCKCPTGYEGNQCTTKSTDRFVGVYDGTTTIDGQPPFVDSMVVDYNATTTDKLAIRTLKFVLYRRSDDIIVGLVDPADGNVIVTDDKFGGRKITITEYNDQINFLSVEKPDGKEQSIKFIGTRRH